MVSLDFKFSDAMNLKLLAYIYGDTFAMSIHDEFCVQTLMDF